MLRSQGYITKLYDLRDKLHSEILTVETMYQNIDEDEGKENNTIANKIFFARSNKTPNGWSYDHVGFITQDGKQIQMSGHKGNDVYVTNAVTDDPEFPKQNIKIVSLSKPVSVPTTNSVGAENCGTFVANVLQANGVKDIDTQKIYSVFKNPHEQGVTESKNNNTAISLSKLGKFHPGADALAEFVPERASAQYALHPDKWESTFYSLTNKDSDKLRYYGPKKISILPGTLVGDMAIANKFYRAKTSEEKQQYAKAYKASLQSYPVDVSQYRMPELLIPRQNVDEAFDTNNNSKLDEILYKLCNIVKKEIKEKTGEHAVAACIIDPDNRIVAKTSKDKHGRWIHAERNAIDTYEKKYGEVPEGSIIVTTLSPCNEYDDRTSDERFGESCTDYINSKGIKKVYCGYMDPTQDNYNREFNVIETSDNDLQIGRAHV